MEEQEDRHLLFSSFLDRHRLFIWKLCSRYADGDPAVGLDYVQEITILLWLRFHKLRPDAHPRQEEKWIRYIAKDCFRYLSWKKKIPLEPYDDDKPSPASLTPADKPADLLAEYMVCLTALEREAVDLYVEGYKTKEMAQILGISPSSVRQRLHRAMLRMKKYASVIDNPTQ